jgi:DNA-binding MarR family transcriptional regulator
MPHTLAQDIKKRQPFDDPVQEAYLNLLRTHTVLTAPSERMFKQHGISPAKYNILRILRGAKSTGESCAHGLPSLEIAARLITRVPDITRLVDGLEADGYVIRTRCTEDRRVVYVGITASALELLDRLEQPLRDSQQQVLGHMTTAELEQLSALLVKARHNEE